MVGGGNEPKKELGVMDPNANRSGTRSLKEIPELELRTLSFDADRIETKTAA